MAAAFLFLTVLLVIGLVPFKIYGSTSEATPAPASGPAPLLSGELMASETVFGAVALLV